MFKIENRIKPEQMERDNLICFNCIHNNDFSFGCTAFPDGIPEEILLSNVHDFPLSYQNNDLVFTQKPEP